MSLLVEYGFESYADNDTYPVGGWVYDTQSASVSASNMILANACAVLSNTKIRGSGQASGMLGEGNNVLDIGDPVGSPDDRFISDDFWFGFTISPNSDALYLDSLEIRAVANGTVSDVNLRYRLFASFDGFVTSSEIDFGEKLFDNSGGIVPSSLDQVLESWDLQDERFQGITNQVEFRAYPYGSDTTFGKVRIDSIKLYGKVKTPLDSAPTIEAHKKNRYEATRLTTSGNPDSSVGLIINGSNASSTESEPTYQNFNGPCVIRIPDWIASGDRADPTANYYMYYSHHAGEFIRMAWAANIEGPWTEYRSGDTFVSSNTRTVTDGRGVLDLGGGTLDLGANTIGDFGGIAGPHPIVDDENEKIILIFDNGMNSLSIDTGSPQGGNTNQWAFISTSSDGLNFHRPSEGGQTGHGIKDRPIAPFYLKPFKIRDRWYGVTNWGHLHTAPATDPFDPTEGLSTIYWTQAPTQILEDIFEGSYPASERDDGFAYYNYIRHSSVRVISDYEADVFFTVTGDAPERIKRIRLDVTDDDPSNWIIHEFQGEEILQPEETWEGAGVTVERSETGTVTTPANQLRDPCVFEDTDGSLYLFYAGGGEQGIGVASLQSFEVDSDDPVIEKWSDPLGYWNLGEFELIRSGWMKDGIFYTTDPGGATEVEKGWTKNRRQIVYRIK